MSFDLGYDFDAASLRSQTDPFLSVWGLSDKHRLRHGEACSVYPSGCGPLLNMMARITRPARVLELGTGLGSSLLHLAQGAGPTATVISIDESSLHTKLARDQVRKHGFA